jgi:eukaryotic-like serine/threonine-protein kinase
MIGKVVSHYKILSKLGEGGMGVVYKAEDLKLTRIVALKFLPHGLDAHEPERARFLQEARAAAILNHPNICTVYDIQEPDDPPNPTSSQKSPTAFALKGGSAENSSHLSRTRHC